MFFSQPLTLDPAIQSLGFETDTPRGLGYSDEVLSDLAVQEVCFRTDDDVSDELEPGIGQRSEIRARARIDQETTNRLDNLLFMI